MTSDPKLPQCAAVDGCDSYGHPLRCESVATSQKTGLCDRHAAIDKPLPIPTYKVIVWPDDGDRVGSDIIKCDDGSGPWCDADDVRGLVERAVKAEAQRDRLESERDAVTEALRDIIAAAERAWMPVQVFRGDDEVARDDIRHEMAQELADIARKALADVEKEAT